MNEQLHEVIVENIGIIYSGTDKAEAEDYYMEYEKQSMCGYGRAGNKSVTWMIDNDIYCELEV